jgi:bacillithiol system protein YtxJ
MGWFSNTNTSQKLNWTNLESVDDLSAFIKKTDKPILLFKHSTRCAISSMALSSLESDWQMSEEEVYLGFIDLVKYRDVSNACAELTKVVHQSPQVIVINNGEVVHDASHSAIRFDQIKKYL